MYHSETLRSLLDLTQDGMIDISDGDLRFGRVPDDSRNVSTIWLPRAE
jgi:hypothetical protein